MAKETITEALIKLGRNSGWREIMNGPKGKSVSFLDCPENCGRKVSIRFRCVKDARKSHKIVCAACLSKTTVPNNS